VIVMCLPLWYLRISKWLIWSWKNGRESGTTKYWLEWWHRQWWCKWAVASMKRRKWHGGTGLKQQGIYRWYFSKCQQGWQSEFLRHFAPVVDSTVMVDQQMEQSWGFGFVMFEQGSIGVESPQNQHLFRCITPRLGWLHKREMHKKGSHMLQQQ
jgi:hypothetical protein